MDNLRKLAEAATPGPWHCHKGAVGASDHDYSGQQVEIHIADSGTRDAAYIAAANPQAILDLLDEIETLKSLNYSVHISEEDQAKLKAALKEPK